jgi:hypothetical protein
MNDQSATRSERRAPPKPVRLERMAPPKQCALIANLMDTFFVIPGTKIRFGFDAIIGLFPGVGDSIGALISTFIIAQASRMGVPRIILARMAMNILTNTLLGVIPILGDIFSVFYRSNLKNSEVLRRHVGQQRRTSQGLGFRHWFLCGDDADLGRDGDARIRVDQKAHHDVRMRAPGFFDPLQFIGEVQIVHLWSSISRGSRQRILLLWNRFRIQTRFLGA